MGPEPEVKAFTVRSNDRSNKPRLNRNPVNTCFTTNSRGPQVYYTVRSVLTRGEQRKRGREGWVGRGGGGGGGVHGFTQNSDLE